MYTEYLGPINRKDIDQSTPQLEIAARKLQQGGLVAFPSETVYGLGATILNESALKVSVPGSPVSALACKFNVSPSASKIC